MPTSVRAAVDQLMCIRGSLVLYSIATRMSSSIAATALTPSSPSFQISR